MMCAISYKKFDAGAVLQELKAEPAISATSAFLKEKPHNTAGFRLDEKYQRIAISQRTPQNHCAACGKFIPVYVTDWTYTTDGTLLHLGGEFGDTCLSLLPNPKGKTHMKATVTTASQSPSYFIQIV